MRFRLKLLGAAAVLADGQPITGRATQKRRIALLAVLAAGGRAGVTRDRLMALLWPEADAERGRHLLSDSVYRINQALGDEAVVAIGDALALGHDRIDSDLEDFTAACDEERWADALALYQGPLLDGFHISESLELERWIETERDKLARRFARAAEQLADQRAAAGDALGAVEAWRALVDHDPLSARVALGYMKALEAAGERTAAIRHARVHAQLLEQELGLPPDASIEAYAEQLRAAPPPDKPQIAATRDLDSSATLTPAAAERSPIERTSVASTALPASPDSTAGAGDVSELAPRAPALVTSTHARAALRFRIRSAAIGAVALALVIALAVWVIDRAGTPDRMPTTIAVLPFADLSPQAGLAYLSDGITEELITSLAKVPGLRVAARTSSFAFKGKPSDVKTVGEQLGVEAVLEGSVRISGDALRVTAQLVNVKDGYNLWAETYERRMDDAFAIQDDIAQQIIASLGRTRPAEPTLASRDSTPPVDPRAYDLFLKGRYSWHQRTREGLLASAQYLEEAVELAPRYARAHAGLGEAYAVIGFYDYMNPSEAFPLAAAAARTALSLDPSLSSSYCTLGYVALYHDWDFVTSEREFRRAIALDSSYSTAHQWYANLLTAWGRFREAERAMRRAMELDPLSLIANAALGWVHYYSGEYERAVSQLDRTLELNSDFLLARMWKGQAYVEAKRFDSALVVLEDVVQRANRTALSLAVLAHARAASGDTSGARELLREIAELAGAAYVPSFEIARVHVALGDHTRALEWLERAARQRAHSIAFLTVDPALAALRGNPRFEQLVRLRAHERSRN